MPHLPELGFYTLAGAPASTRDLIGEVRRAEELGLGHCFISERFNVKEAATVSGAVGAGCDGVILHGATPDELEPVVAAYAARA